MSCRVHTYTRADSARKKEINVSEIQWTSDDVPRLSLGVGVSPKGDKRRGQIIGTYLYSIQQRIKKRRTVLHRFGDVIVDGEKIQGECLVYGSGSVNNRLSFVPSGTPVRLVYKGEKDVGMDSPMKEVSVEWPRGTKLLDTPKSLKTAKDDEDDSDTDDVVF